jgi:cell division protein FtsI (penicillin-binding protein 3)
MDLSTLHRYYRLFGFGEMTSVEFLGEQDGYLPDPDTVDSITRHTQAFGQGLSTTTAQMAGAYQAIANGGVRIPLRLVSGCEHADGEFVSAPEHESVRVVSESTARETLRILETVPESGTLHTRVNVPGYRIAAKTGTAEIAENGEYGDERMISIAGMVPADEPQYVVVVAFVKPQTNRFSYAAAPAFDAIVTQVVKHFRVAPSGPGPGLPPLTW